jgi:hypothetical protein
MKKFIFLFVFIFFIGIYFACYTAFLSVPSMNVLNVKEAESIPAVSIYADKEAALLNFIESRMVGEEGQIYTNAKPQARSEGTLSESVGLLMNYCLLRDRKDLFDKELNYLKKYLMTKDNLIVWKDSAEKASCNALIDDLRIVSALLDANDKWSGREYYNFAGFIQDSIFEKQVTEASLYELFDWKSNANKKRIPLCYFDLYTLDRMSEFNKAWLEVEEEGKKIINNGIMEAKSPLFYKYFDYTSNKYLPDEEYRKSKGVCLTYTLYTALHLAEMNEDTTPFTDWLSKEINNGKLYGWYNPKTLKPVNELESTAVYALAAIYSRKVGEEGLYHKLVDHMLTFMVTDTNSPNYGGFGDEQTGDFYSFDNLTALWALGLE